MDNKAFDKVVGQIAENYRGNSEICFNCMDRHFPSRGAVIGIIKDLRRILFPRYFGDEGAVSMRPEYFIGSELTQLREALRTQIREALRFEQPIWIGNELNERVEQIVDAFLEKLPEIQRVLLTDVQAAFDGDPAAQSKEEIIFSYPGFFAIFVYRLAHELYLQKVPLIPRIMSEYAHDHSGVDINPGATIDEYFFIDHATGVVIGETCIIGKNVKIYQGVTLGALSTRAGQGLRGVKRHPTIEDNVTIYSNASVLGGDTVIGAGSVIAGSIFVTESVPANSRVSAVAQELKIRQAGDKTKPEAWEKV